MTAEQALSSLPPHIKIPILSDQGPTLMTSFSLNHFSSPKSHSGIQASVYESVWITNGKQKELHKTAPIIRTYLYEVQKFRDRDFPDREGPQGRWGVWGEHPAGGR